MRTKLTDIISTMEQFIGVVRFSDEYVIMEIDTDVDDIPETESISNEQEVAIKEMLTIRQHKNKLNERAPYIMEYVKPLGQFISEINQSTYTTTQSYFGCLDDSDDEEE